MLFTIFFFKLYNKTSNRLIAYLAMTDFLHSIGTQIDYVWINNSPATGTFACRLQGFLFTYCDVSSSFWALSICLFTLLCGLLRISKIKFEIISIFLCVVVPFILAISGFGVQNATQTEFYANVGIWCWISNDFKSYRFPLDYLWVFISIILLFFFYFIIGYNVYTVKSKLKINEEENKKWSSTLKKLSGYPILFFVEYFPQTLDHLLVLLNYTPSESYAMFAGCLIGSNGFCNAILYGLTRKIFQRYMNFFMRLEVSGKSNKDLSMTQIQTSTST